MLLSLNSFWTPLLILLGCLLNCIFTHHSKLRSSCISVSLAFFWHKASCHLSADDKTDVFLIDTRFSFLTFTGNIFHQYPQLKWHPKCNMKIHFLSESTHPSSLHIYDICLPLLFRQWNLSSRYLSAYISICAMFSTTLKNTVLFYSCILKGLSGLGCVLFCRLTWLSCVKHKLIKNVCVTTGQQDLPAWA